mmetsp:Transcript_25217/g.76533  ORF Transcript_25217/g.76533 Transcript_25217/m.76533 type:complete len:200 (+) Transcript_25217:261-860(+)
MRGSFRSVARAKVLGAALGRKFARLFIVIIDLEGIEDGLIHVEVFIRGQATDEAYPFFLLSQLAVALVKCTVFRVRHRIVGVSLCRGVLSCDERPLHLSPLHFLGLVGHVFVLNNTRKRHICRGIVHHHGLLEEAVLGLRHPYFLKPNRSILELWHALLREVRIDWAGVDQHAILGKFAGSFRSKEINTEAKRNVRIVE